MGDPLPRGSEPDNAILPPPETPQPPRGAKQRAAGAGAAGEAAPGDEGCNSKVLDSIGQGKSATPEIGRAIRGDAAALSRSRIALPLPKRSTVQRSWRGDASACLESRCLQRTGLDLKVRRVGRSTAQGFATARRRSCKAVLGGLLFACERGGHTHCLWCDGQAMNAGDRHTMHTTTFRESIFSWLGLAY